MTDERIQRPGTREIVSDGLPARSVRFKIETLSLSPREDGKSLLRIRAWSRSTGERFKAEFIIGGDRIMSNEIGEALIVPENYNELMIKKEVEVFTDKGLSGLLVSSWIDKGRTK